MKLLLDHNLSPRLVETLAEAFPGMCHVATSGLDRATDLSVWEHARERGLAIVSKDSDFSDLAMLRGTPPKVIWLRIGNATTREAQAVLSGNQPRIEAFLVDPGLRVLVLR